MEVGEILEEISKIDDNLKSLNRKIELFYNETPKNLLEMSDDIQKLFRKIEDDFSKGSNVVKNNKKTYDEIDNKILLSPELVTIAEMRLYHKLKEVYQ